MSAHDVRAGVDYPFSFYWTEHIKNFPDAKVVLSTRDPKSWYTSVRDTIRLMGKSSNQFPISWMAPILGMKGMMRV